MNDDGFKADCEEHYSLPLGNLPRREEEDQLCPHAVQVALSADGNGASASWATPTMVGNVGGGEDLLAHPPGITLRQRFEEEELLFWHEGLLDGQDGARCSSLTGCQSTILIY